MPTVCFYFQMHQPMRLRRYSVFETKGDYFDDSLNRRILTKVAEKCYVPATRMLVDLAERHDGDFRISFSITGTLIEQLREDAPMVLDLLQKLNDTGCVEFLAETYHHSLSFLYSRDEFADQVARHRAAIQDLFGQAPTVFRNTELIYNNDLAHHVSEMGYSGILVEGADKMLGGRSPNRPYRPPHADTTLLLRNYRLSDDIAFRFSNREWAQWPLSAQKFAQWIGELRGDGADERICNLFIDYETFGEHQWAETGIFDFLDAVPGAVLDSGSRFMTVGEAVRAHPPVDTLDVSDMVSWADTERDLSAWIGNAMQSNALHELYRIEREIKRTDNAALIEDWRRLTVSDHFYYMCTKYYADGAVHGYFSPYESPYDSYINFMNVLDHVKQRIGS